MKESKIEWTDYTWNPWIGCTKVSDGCKNCYAENLMDTRYKKVSWGKGKERVLTSEENWKKPERLDRLARKKGIRIKIFMASLADFFDDEVPDEWRNKVMDLIEYSTNIDWLIVTKRPENAYKYLKDNFAEMERDLKEDHKDNQLLALELYDKYFNEFRNKLWIGVSVENQKAADERIPILLDIPAKVRFLSMEPLLGEVNLNYIEGDIGIGLHSYDVLNGKNIHWDDGGNCTNCPKIDWVIVGGESGHNARPMLPDWARFIRDQCQEAGVPFFFKQWGEYFPREQGEWNTSPLEDYYLADDRMPEFVKVGKKKAGSLLDGREWKEFPVS